MQIDCVSVIADDQATEPEEKASNDWSFQRGFNQSPNNGAIQTPKGLFFFCTNQTGHE